MCGIFGIVTRDDQVLGETLVGAARRLSYRGYDSVGAATVDGAGRVDLRKDVGKVDAVAPRLGLEAMRGRRGIVQLRWATFGAPSQVNSQPHLDSDGEDVRAIDYRDDLGLRARGLFSSLVAKLVQDSIDSI